MDYPFDGKKPGGRIYSIIKQMINLGIFIKGRKRNL